MEPVRYRRTTHAGPQRDLLDRCRGAVLGDKQLACRLQHGVADRCGVTLSAAETNTVAGMDVRHLPSLPQQVSATDCCSATSKVSAPTGDYCTQGSPEGELSVDPPAPGQRSDTPSRRCSKPSSDTLTVTRSLGVR